VKITDVAPTIGIIFSMVKAMSQKMDWATFLGDFFTNASGHPGRQLSLLTPRLELVFLTRGQKKISDPFSFILIFLCSIEA
jgi:hypothetical protein